MSINTPTEPHQKRSGPLGPVVQEEKGQAKSTHMHGVIWRQPDGKLETKNYSPHLPLKGQL